MPARSKGEIDLVGDDGKTLALVELRTRAVVKGEPAVPEYHAREARSLGTDREPIFCASGTLPYVLCDLT